MTILATPAFITTASRAPGSAQTADGPPTDRQPNTSVAASLQSIGQLHDEMCSLLLRVTPDETSLSGRARIDVCPEILATGINLLDRLGIYDRNRALAGAGCTLASHPATRNA